MVPELDQHAVTPEGGDEPVEGAPGRGGPVVEERARDRALAAPGEHEPRVVAGARPEAVEVNRRAGGTGEGGEVETGRALLPRQLRRAHCPGQTRVPDRALGEHHEVLTGRVGVAVRRRAERVERELGAEHGGKTGGAGGEGEAHHAVEAVVVGDGEGGQAQPGGLVGQLLGMAGAVEEREVRVAVQLRVATGHWRPLLLGAAHHIERTFDQSSGAARFRSGSGWRRRALPESSTVQVDDLAGVHLVAQPARPRQGRRRARSRHGTRRIRIPVTGTDELTRTRRATYHEVEARNVTRNRGAHRPPSRSLRSPSPMPDDGARPDRRRLRVPR